MNPTMQLKQGDTVLGALIIDDGDMPWWHGHFQPAPDFEPLRPAFDAWFQAVEDGDESAMDSAYRSLEALGLVIIAAGDSEPIAEFMLHVNDNRFRLRY
ncbi:hypothetical protein [Actinacidiphila rubida]|uniref:Uncharacterized protein n=1 Tax=Actinacidiphila rubida TaxID=310780 RepID=A0A1H8ECR2_9ACTN|nr:hypothetical protein [Actinacidiphila rubida]SEN17285.1 hypothetical protein SAMN05216267_1002135 [Actinacidiphila rubida]